MAIPSSLVGLCTPPFVHQVDARWLMAYAAALGHAGIIPHGTIATRDLGDGVIELAVRTSTGESGVRDAFVQLQKESCP